ncbi:hypothetical protein VTK73DRAFT_4993 [Phialemonium thermophilum]|uniref:Uncharacterized protein n=1 Tax=Phialemonium thermophilum TaxID=223376 RepID=A0ABR3WR71_9PEZI
MDFAMGPNQGTGVPAPSDSDGLMWDLDAYNVTVPIGGTFDDRLPGWGAGVLQAAVTGLVIRSEQATGVEPGLPGDPAASRTQHTLSTESLQVVTDRVDKNGRLRIEFDPRAEGLHHVVFAVYLQHSLYRAQDGPLDIGGPQTPATTLAGNGSWAVDHFSRRGAETTIGFWEKHILPNGTLELLAEAGNYGWEDSVEIQSNIYWTKDFLDIFQKEHGYSIARWLPLLFHRNGNGRNSAYPVWWITDEPDNGTSHIADYRTTLGKQYDDYISTLNAWVKSRLGLHFSAQVAYQLPMDMMPNIPSVDIPECETLDFEDLIDGYRLYSGPATLGNRNIISSECGAVHGEVFAQMWPELLWHVKRSYAGSVNQFVLHGFPYTGNYGNTTWPVYTTFNYQYSAMHGPRDPAWAFYRDYLDYIARNNYILQQGTPKMDVAIWQKNTVYPKHVKIRRYEPADLERAGYTYEYLSPDNFDLPSATVRDGVLAPDAQGFKALVVRANDTLTIDGVSKLVGFAQAHLPIVFLGGLPSTYLGTNKAEAVRASQSALKKITTLSNVHVTDSYDGLASVLASIGIQPAARFVTDAPNWYTLRRVDSQSHSEYYFVYNDAPGVPRGTGKAKATVQFQSSGVPYKLDAWTGEETPILTYTRSGSSTSIPITLAGNQTTLVVFRAEGGYATQQHVADVSAEVLGLSALKNGSVALHTAARNVWLRLLPARDPSFCTTGP